MIVVVGSINMDLVTRVKRAPQAGETLLAESFASHHGGKGANQAVAAARAGAGTRFVGRVGDDVFGARLRQGLENEGIDCSQLGRCGGASGIALITVEADGENRIIVVPGANAALQPKDLSASMFAGANVLLMQLEIPLPTVLNAAAVARPLGVETILNAAPAAALGGADLIEFDWLLVNETEVAQLLGEKIPADVDAALAAARRLHGTGPQVVVTLGARGAVWSSRDHGEGHQPAFAGMVVDTTAAGDAFAGVFSAARADGLAVPECVRRACAAGSLAVRRPGAQPSLPERSEVDTLLAQEEA